LEADALTLEIADMTDTFGGEQLEAADMDAGQHDDRRPGLDHPRQIVEGEAIGEIDLAACYSLVLGRSGHDFRVADVGKTLGPKQVLGDIFRGNANTAVIDQPDGRRFEGTFGSQSRRRVQQARGAS
jgi:hypothetical protein